MKKTYMCPDSVLLKMETEQMIAASAGLPVNPNENADQWSNRRNGWDSDSWLGGKSSKK